MTSFAELQQRSIDVATELRSRGLPFDSNEFDQRGWRLNRLIMRERTILTAYVRTTLETDELWLTDAGAVLLVHAGYEPAGDPRPVTRSVSPLSEEYARQRDSDEGWDTLHEEPGSAIIDDGFRVFGPNAATEPFSRIGTYLDWLRAR